MKGNTQDMFWHKLWKSERAVNNWNTSLAWSRLTYSFVTRSVNRQALFFYNIVIISISQPYLKHSMCFAGKSFDSFPQERVLHFINSFTSANRIHTILFFSILNVINLLFFCVHKFALFHCSDILFFRAILAFKISAALASCPKVIRANCKYNEHSVIFLPLGLCFLGFRLRTHVYDRNCGCISMPKFGDLHIDALILVWNA